MKRAIIIFQKALVMGEVKTRIAETLGAAEALHIYAELRAHTHEIVNSLKQTETFIFQNKLEGTGEAIRFSSPRVFLQQGNDLGEKMKHAFLEVFAQGFDQVLIIGTDCLDLNTSHLEKAFDLLSQHDSVIGPAMDGGYYLLGLRKMVPELFHNIPWSTSEVFAKTCEILAFNGLSFACLEQLSDIDTAEDWRRAQEKKNKNKA
ncbi:MAG: TIGR04282 family arsenosugar biosynthesis glycosyltransferase [Mongoliitalea sp.]